MRDPEQTAASASQPDAVNRLSVATDHTARIRARLRASEEAMTTGVLEFQLARQRAELVDLDTVEPLSPREREVVRLLAAGRSDGEIADELLITKKTASVHVANIKGKLGASSRVETAMIATHLGLADGVDTTGAGGAARTSAFASVVICPFKGLASYEAADSGFFFGRERLVAELVARLAGSSLLGVVGSSGSGKSSVIRAGLIPALRAGVLPGSEHWRVVILRPGESPADELDRALAQALSGTPGGPDREGIGHRLDGLPVGARLVCVVDQFEEAFTHCRDENERRSFLAALTSMASDPAGRAVVILAIRAEFYGRCAEYAPLAEMVAASAVLVGPPTPDELRRAVELPSRAARLRAEPELVAALVRDVADEPGGLPVLSTTLLELWQRRDGRTLRFDTYERLGGVAGAVARLAESAFARLEPDEQDVARELFLRLGAEGEGGATVRRRVPMDEFDPGETSTATRVIAALTEARLLSVDDGFVEVAHEALLQEWPRMRAWLEEDAEGARVRQHLARAAQEWDLGGRDELELYRGARLVATLDWAAGHTTALNHLERSFLDESRSAMDREVGRERRTNRRLRGLLTIVVGLMLVAVATGAVAVDQSRTARDQAALAAQQETAAQTARRDAEAAARLARSRELVGAAASTLDEDPALSRLLAVAAADLGPIDRSVATALHRAWLADASIDRYTVPADEPIEGLFADLHPDGRLIVTTGGPFADVQGSLSVVDLETNARRWQYRPASSAVRVGPAFFSIDGRRVVGGVSWQPPEDGNAPPAPDALGVVVWDAQSGTLLNRFDTGRCGGRLLAVSVTVALVLTRRGEAAPGDCRAGDTSQSLETIDLTTGARTTLIDGALGDGTLSRDGRFAAFADAAREAFAVVELGTGRRILSFGPAATDQLDRGVRALSADGSLLLFGDRPIVVIEVATGEVIATLADGEGESYGAEFGPDGSIAYTAGRDGALRGWEGGSGQALFVVPGAGGGRPSAATDGRVLVTDFATNTATLFDPRLRGELATIETCRGFVPAGSLKVVGEIAAVSMACNDERPTYVADLVRSIVTATAPDADGQDLAMTADGTRFVRQVSQDHVLGSLWIHDTKTGRALIELEGLCAWDETRPGPRTGSGPCKAFPMPPFAIWNVAVEFSPDGRFVAAIDHGDYEGFLAIWDATTGALLDRQPDVPASVWDIAFSRDSRVLIVATTDGELIAFSTDSWAISHRQIIDPSIDDRTRMGLAGFLGDGTTLIGMSGYRGTGGGSLHRIDTETLIAGAGIRAHDGAPKSMAISPDGRLLVTGAADGVVRVWDGASLVLLHELNIGTQAQGVAFVGNDRVAVAPQGGGILVMALEADSLLETVRGTLTRSFEPEECQRFQIDPCPSLDQVRASP